MGMKQKYASRVQCYVVSCKKTYSMDFHGRVTKLLEIYSVMDARVGNIKKNF